MDLPLAKLKSLLESVIISSLNFGTGESGLHPEWPQIVQLIRERGLKASLTSNGYTVGKMSSDELKVFHDVDISIDMPTAEEHDRWRGKGAWKTAVDALEKCLQADVPVSIVSCMMNNNYKKLDKLADVAGKYGITLRTNIYKPVHTREFELTYDQFWHGIGIILNSSILVTCSEPVVNAVLRRHVPQTGCGRSSLRIRPDGMVVPCVYWPRAEVHMDAILRGTPAPSCGYQRVPQKCAEVKCEHVDTCRGGCAGRRIYYDINQPDPYCPIIREDHIQLNSKEASHAFEFIHSNYLCTIIVKANGGADGQ